MSFSSICVLRFDIPNGITCPEWISNVKIYPNPTAEEVTFDFGNSIDKHSELNILDINGKIVISLIDEGTGLRQNLLKWNCKKMNGNRVSDGIYFLKVSDGHFSRLFPIIVSQIP